MTHTVHSLDLYLICVKCPCYGSDVTVSLYLTLVIMILLLYKAVAFRGSFVEKDDDVSA